MKSGYLIILTFGFPANTTSANDTTAVATATETVRRMASTGIATNGIVNATEATDGRRKEGKCHNIFTRYAFLLTVKLSLCLSHSRYSQQSGSYSSSQHYNGPGGGPDVGAYYGSVGGEDFSPGYRERYHTIGGGGSGGRGATPMDWGRSERSGYDDYRRSGEYDRRPPPTGS